jgi:hypothetical protein
MAEHDAPRARGSLLLRNDGERHRRRCSNFRSPSAIQQRSSATAALMLGTKSRGLRGTRRAAAFAWNARRGHARRRGCFIGEAAIRATRATRRNATAPGQGQPRPMRTARAIPIVRHGARRIGPARSLRRQRDRATPSDGSNKAIIRATADGCQRLGVEAQVQRRRRGRLRLSPKRARELSSPGRADPVCRRLSRAPSRSEVRRRVGWLAAVNYRVVAWVCPDVRRLPGCWHCAMSGMFDRSRAGSGAREGRWRRGGGVLLSDSPGGRAAAGGACGGSGDVRGRGCVAPDQL